MNRNYRGNAKKERIIMIASSALVLGALTMTGLYMKNQEIEEQDDGYTLDIGALEENLDDKTEKIAQAETEQMENTDLAEAENAPELSLDDDLDYMPMEEAGSSLVEIPGLTDDKAEEDAPADAVDEITADQAVADTLTDADNQEANAETVTETRELHFPEVLMRPVSGEVLIPYSMSASVYFATLDQYKYNPAVIYDAEEGMAVTACAEGQVISVFTDSELGTAVTLDLGDGYTATYGQLATVAAVQGDYIDAGAQLGTVGAPSKYYSVEGANLYFCLEKDGEAINPEGLFQ